MRERGFTLLEVLLSVAIFLLIAGAIFTAVTVGVRSSTALAQHRLKAEQMDTLLEYLRDSFVSLPAGMDMANRGRQSMGGGDAIDLLVRQAPGAFALMNASGSAGGTALSVIRGRGGRPTLAVKKFPDSLSDAERDREIENPEGWVELMGGIQKIRWRFFNPTSNQLEETWTFGQGRPSLVEFTLWLEGEEPITAVFWIPTLEALTAAPPPRKAS